MARTPFAQVSLGEKTWRWANGELKSVSVTSAEGNEASNCDFSLYDPERIIIDELLEFIESIEGLEPVSLPETRSTGVLSGTGTASGNLSANMRAMLDTISWAEGADYNTLFGSSTFSSYEDHPRRTITKGGFSSTAAGRYQFLSTTWDEVAAQLKLPDFSPESQDLAAVQLIKNRGAFDAVEAGDIPQALLSLSYEWASLPYG